MKTDHSLTADEIRTLCSYSDGALYWRDRTDPRKAKGPIGSRSGHVGRLQVGIKGTARYVHRLIWLHQTGSWPTDQIDHVNGNPHDNRIENLREISAEGNSCNRRIVGVSFDTRKVERPWRARIMVKGKSISLGYYDTKAAAMSEYQRAKLAYHPAYASGIAAA